MKAWIIVLSIVILAMIGYFVYYYVTMRHIKTPAYSVIKKDGNIEIRRYAPMLIAQVNVSGDREQAINRGFRLLADYIFGNNTASTGEKQQIAMTAPVMQSSSQKIAMTAPVVQSAINDNQGWLVQFVLPSQYTLDTVPKPNNSDVKLISIPEQDKIVIRFSGSMTQRNLQSHLTDLQRYIKTHQINALQPPQYAFYNPPWTLPFMRRNEIMFIIKM